MTNDLVAALREAREFVRKRYLTMGDKEANELIAHIDAALSAASGEASVAHLRQCDCCGQMKECTNMVAYGMDTTVCEDCSSRPTPNPAGLSRKSREILNGDAYEIAPPEAPNVERTTLDVQTQAERPPSVADNFSADELVWLDLVEKDDRTSPPEYPNHALITREELFAALDSARAEGNAAERERIEAIVRSLIRLEETACMETHFQDESNAHAGKAEILRVAAAAICTGVKP